MLPRGHHHRPHLAELLPRLEVPVLAVDLEPHGNLYFDVPTDADPTLTDVLAGRAKALGYRPDLGADYLAVADELLERRGLGSKRRGLAQLRAELLAA